MDASELRTLAERIALAGDECDAAAVLADAARLLIRERVLSAEPDAVITPSAVQSVLELRLRDPAAYDRRVSASRLAEPWMPRNRMPRRL